MSSGIKMNVGVKNMYVESFKKNKQTQRAGPLVTSGRPEHGSDFHPDITADVRNM